MRIYRINPGHSNVYNCKPIENIAITLNDDVPCLSVPGSILPIRPLKSTKDYLLKIKLLKEEYRQYRKSTKDYMGENIDKEYFKDIYKPYFIKNAIVKQDAKGVTFLEETESSQDTEVIVKLELPLSAAQPYYKFEGDIEILAGRYTTYYDANSEIEAENQLCEAIIKMGDRAKVSFTYTNRNGEGIVIKEMMGIKFEFACYQGKLFTLNEYNFLNSYSDFKI